MKHYLIWILSVCVLLMSSAAVFAKGEIRAINCSKQHLYIGAADWDDASGGWTPYSHHWVAPHRTARLDCAKTWTDSNAPGCKIVLSASKNPIGSMGMGRKNTGHYYAYYHQGCYIFKLGNTCPNARDLEKAAEACN